MVESLGLVNYVDTGACLSVMSCPVMWPATLPYGLVAWWPDGLPYGLPPSCCTCTEVRGEVQGVGSLKLDGRIWQVPAAIGPAEIMMGFMVVHRWWSCV